MTDRMIKGINFGSDGRLRKKLSENGELSVIFLGGSITAGYCRNIYLERPYPVQLTEYLVQTTKRDVRCINLAVSTFSSSMGIIQYSRFDTIPDIVFLEYAVNDSFDIYNATTFESLVRKILCSEGAPAVIVICSCRSDGTGCAAFMRETADFYGLPSFSVSDLLSPDELSKYCPDGIHPEEYGHELLASACEYIINNAPDNDILPVPIEYVFGNTFESIRFYDSRNLNIISDLSESYSYNDMFSNGFSHVIGNGAFLLFNVPKGSHCGTINVIHIINNDAKQFGRCDILVNGKMSAILDGYSIYGWNNPVSFGIKLDKTTDSIIELRMHKGDEGKDFRILGFGY